MAMRVWADWDKYRWTTIVNNDIYTNILYSDLARCIIFYIGRTYQPKPLLATIYDHYIYFAPRISLKNFNIWMRMAESSDEVCIICLI